MHLLHLSLISTLVFAQLPLEKHLWSNGISNNPVKYKEEKQRTSDVQPGSPSGLNRVFSCVSTPTYIIHKPQKPNGLALVICPGGGFRDVWFDREGNDFALWLAQHGITSLVLKYRTYNSDDLVSKMSLNDYFPHVYADAKKAIYILRSQGKELGIDENKIGIAGYSAGGALSLLVGLELLEKEIPTYTNFGQTSTTPNFLCLIYPGISPQIQNAAEKKSSLLPAFFINGAEDNVTPASNCIDLYKTFLSKKAPAELHIYAKGGHGFDSGIGRGQAIATWQESFIIWLKDMKFLQE
ncbi:MAG: alpha/beta hydrolase [Bacteroidales bacterium]|nr:alpha/beta hydrolase [Bacteroidales bacterium]